MRSHFSPCKYYFNILSRRQQRLLYSYAARTPYKVTHTHARRCLQLCALCFVVFLLFSFRSQTLCNKQCFIISSSTEARGDKPCQRQTQSQAGSQGKARQGKASQNQAANFLYKLHFMPSHTHTHTHMACFLVLCMKFYEYFIMRVMCACMCSCSCVCCMLSCRFVSHVLSDQVAMQRQTNKPRQQQQQ